jgi:hypothetical protein
LFAYVVLGHICVVTATVPALIHMLLSMKKKEGVEAYLDMIFDPLKALCIISVYYS